MSQPPEVENFGDIIKPYLEENGKKLISYKSRYLTNPGENYGSVMLGITANIQTLNGNTEELELVAKLPPKLQEFWEVFQPERTFITETKFYTILAPEFKKLQMEAGIKDNEIIDIFPECYGARFNLHNNDEIVDKNATLVLENLTINGYKVGDRFKGFNYEHALIIVRDLAYYHALSIALRKLKPEVFQTKIKPFVSKFDMGKNFTPEVKQEFEQMHSKALRIAGVFEEDIMKIMDLFKIADERERDLTECPDGPYTTIIHSDFWVNNMMISYDNDGKPLKTKIVDFQIAQYDHLANDLIFFLFTSVESKVLKENCEKLLHQYYNSFVTCQEKLGCDTSDCSYQSFMDEINRMAYLRIPQIIMMLRVLFLQRNAIANFDEMDTNLLSDDTKFGEEYYEKLYNTIKLLKKFGWFDIRE